MKSILLTIWGFLKERVAAGDIYVWGGSGKLAAAITEAWIRAKEADCQGGSYADRAVRAWKAKVSAGLTAFRAYDCSGLVSYALMLVGIIAERLNCDGLWALCDRIATPINGALLFRVNDKDPEDETHVGFYFDGCQYHAKGRDDGVVCEPYDASYWDKIGWCRALEKDDVEPDISGTVDGEDLSEIDFEEATQIDPPYVQAKGTVRVRKMAGKSVITADMTEEARRIENDEHARIYTTTDGERLPYLGTKAKNGWYKVETSNGIGFISNKAKYTILVTE
jgi:hypothetical protein